MKKAVKCLISAGPTREWLDPVRFISNPSSGKMGYALAKAAVESGMEVILVSGPVSLPCPENVERKMVNTASEMNELMKNYFPSANLTIMSAAVCDHRPASTDHHKVKKLEVGKNIALVPNPDILEGLGKIKRPGQILVGFAAETERHLENGKKKLRQKNLDWIAVNEVAEGKGFESDKNEITMISSSGQSIFFERGGKLLLARKILDAVWP